MLQEPTTAQLISELHDFRPPSETSPADSTTKITRCVLRLVKLGDGCIDDIITDYDRTAKSGGRKFTPWYRMRCGAILFAIGTPKALSFLRDRLITGSSKEVKNLLYGIGVYHPELGSRIPVEFIDEIISAVERAQREAQRGEEGWREAGVAGMGTLRVLFGNLPDLARMDKAYINDPSWNVNELRQWWSSVRDKFKPNQ